MYTLIIYVMVFTGGYIEITGFKTYDSLLSCENDWRIVLHRNIKLIPPNQSDEIIRHKCKRNYEV